MDKCLYIVKINSGKVVGKDWDKLRKLLIDNLTEVPIVIVDNFKLDRKKNIVIDGKVVKDQHAIIVNFNSNTYYDSKKKELEILPKLEAYKTYGVGNMFDTMSVILPALELLYTKQPRWLHKFYKQNRTWYSNVEYAEMILELVNISLVNLTTQPDREYKQYVYNINKVIEDYIGLLTSPNGAAKNILPSSTYLNFINNIKEAFSKEGYTAEEYLNEHLTPNKPLNGQDLAITIHTLALLSGRKYYSPRSSSSRRCSYLDLRPFQLRDVSYFMLPELLAGYVDIVLDSSSVQYNTNIHVLLTEHLDLYDSRVQDDYDLVAINDYILTLLPSSINVFYRHMTRTEQGWLTRH